MMISERFPITEGISLNVIKTDKFKTGLFSITFRQRLSKETASANALLFNVLLNGCEKYPDITALSRHLDGLYGADVDCFNQKRGDSQETGIFAKFISSQYALFGENVLEESVKTLLEILLKPLIEDGAFRKSYFLMEKKNQIDFIKAEINDKVSYARTRCIELMCCDDAYGVSEIGDIETLDKLTNEQLYAHYRSLLSDAEIEMFYVGGDEAGNLVGLLKSAFSSVERKNIEKLPDTKIVAATEKSKEFVENMAVNQGKLSLAFATGIVRKDREYPALVLFNAIFGMTPSSKLFVNVREKLSLCYYCRSDVVSNKGILLVSCGIEIENKEKSQVEILKQLEAVKNGEFSDEEMVIAKKSCENGVRSSFDSHYAYVTWVAAELYDQTDRTPESYIEAISALTKKDVMKIASEVKLDTVYFLTGANTEAKV